MEVISKIQVGGTPYGIVPPEGLTEEQQAQARANIGAISSEDADVVRDGTYPDMTVGEAVHAHNADNATNAMNATNATNAVNATNATNAQNATNDGNGNKIDKTYVKISDFNRLILETEYPIGGKPYIQYEGMETPAQRWAGTSWEIDTSMQGRTIIGSGGSYVFSTTGGEETHTMLEAEIAQHTHNEQMNVSDGDSVGEMVYNSSGGSQSGVYLANGAYTITGKGAIRTSRSGNSTPFNIMQPYIVVNFWKRTA